MDDASRDGRTGLVAAQFPGVPVLWLSAKTGEGFSALTEFLDLEGHFGRRILDIDYDIYAEGEAELGWLNSSLTVNAQWNDPDITYLMNGVAPAAFSFAGA